MAYINGIRLLIVQAVNTVIPTNRVAITYGSYEVTGTQSLTINGTGRFIIL